MGKKSVKNYIEWCSQRTKRLDFGPRYDDIMISAEDDFGFFDPFLVAFVLVFVFLFDFVVGFRPREAAHFLSREISRRMPSESCLGTPWAPSYDHIYKNIHLCGGISFRFPSNFASNAFRIMSGDPLGPEL